MANLINLDILRINKHGKNYYGSDQEWYDAGIQRYSGCGPTVCANAILYLSKPKRIPECFEGTDWKCIRGLMDHIWEYVKPGKLGVNSTAMLKKGLEKYAVAEDIDIVVDCLDVCGDKNKRVDFETVSEFLETSFSNEIPVAFLNLSNGDVDELESWHWVLAVGLEQNNLTIYDQGEKKIIDLKKWLSTTMLGGGFVSIGIDR